MMTTATIQAHIGGDWTDAALVTFDDSGRGIAGGARAAYDDTYFFDFACEDAVDAPVIDRRAVSVTMPVNLESHRLDTWPAWALDMMPQGVARRRMADRLGKRPDDPAVELPILLLAGGGPIGNLRIREAWEAERKRIAGVDCPPLTDKDIASRSERFLDVTDRFVHLASGSSGVQGEWPKALLTRHAADGFWYPDPFVSTRDGIEHIIVKLLRSTDHDDALIIASEAPYLEIARDFGLNVAAPLSYGNGVLRIPRFDRAVTDGRLHLHGQESLVSALGIAKYGHVGWHEDYLAMIQAISDDPAADSLEYVMRDVLNAAMGNPDNHGRNTALAKHADGGIRLAPLYDFAPMRLSAAGITRQTRWRCLQGRDLDGQWHDVCQAAACVHLPAERIKETLLGCADRLRRIPRLALDRGVSQEVVDRACTGASAVAGAIDRLERPCHANGR